MADGPRCKRRKQANPRRNHVTTYNNGLAVGSDTDDEDKLHIVEEADGAECDGTLPDEEHPREHHWDHVKEEPLSELEDDRSTDALVEEMLQQGDTAVIYPEAPEDQLSRLGTPEAPGPDENGTPDSFSQLLTCPYCSRGYKRYSSLKEHIKYRHEKGEESYQCSECSYSFCHRAQLDRHMSTHRNKDASDQRHITQSAGNRKFKCTECGKAFKYKHHLKEHLRIHSGEKPYECSHCKKRFSHSGSYSSHISSKKCISVVSVNKQLRPRAQGPTGTALPPPPSSLPSSLQAQTRDQKPLQEQLPLTQIKAEPVDYEFKPTVMVPSAGVFHGGAAAPLQGTVQAVVLPTVGLVSPISINIADLQNALKVAVDGNMIRQFLEGKGQTTLTSAPPQQLLSAISLPILGQDGNAKIIINYSLDPSQTQIGPQNLKKEPLSPNEKLPEDLTLKRGMKEEEMSCVLCEHCPPALDALHALKHANRLNGLDKSESTIATLLSEGGLCNQPKNLLSLLKAYYALNAQPSHDELLKISDSVSLPQHVVQKWFDKMQQGALGAPTPPSEEEDSVVSLVPGKDTAALSPSVHQDSPTEATPAEANHSSPASPSLLNLTAGCPAPSQQPQGPDAPLDLSLPKCASEKEPVSSPSSCNVPEEPLNLSCLKKESLSGVYASQSSAAPVQVLSGQLPVGLVALDEQSSVQCLRALGSSKRTILIPQLAYSYSSAATSPAGTETYEAAIQLNGIKEERPDSEGLSAADEPDSDCGPARKKMKKSESGVYACDLCDKIFQKSSSLLRHKYEHTGKRPHECGICSKAFKHKHHLIEHMRLHSGEKPYQCDKCGKRFSHSGSYSQHMNHRYSYCKREPASSSHQPHGGGTGKEELLDGPLTPPHAQQTLLAPLHTDSDERGSRDSEEEEEEDDDDGAVGIEDIQVVQVEEEEEEVEGEAGMEGDTRQEEAECETEEREEEREDTGQDAAMETEDAKENTMEETTEKATEETSEETSEETLRETLDGTKTDADVNREG